MIRYIVIFIALFFTSVEAQDWAQCYYLPLQTKDHPAQEWQAFEGCATYQDGVLYIAKEQLNNIDFKYQSIASFFTSGQFFYVKPDGIFLPVIAYDNGADYFEEGLTRSVKNGKIEYYNTDFELVLAPGYDWAWPFHEGKALVCQGCALTPVDHEHHAMRGGLWGYINKEGKEIVPVKYPFSELPK